MTAGWAAFAATFAALAGSHFLPGIVGLRESLINKLGRKCYFASYGAISLLFLVLPIGSANRAPFVELRSSLPWTPHVSDARDADCLLSSRGRHRNAVALYPRVAPGRSFLSCRSWPCGIDAACCCSAVGTGAPCRTMPTGLPHLPCISRSSVCPGSLADARAVTAKPPAPCPLRCPQSL